MALTQAQRRSLLSGQSSRDDTNRNLRTNPSTGVTTRNVYGAAQPLTSSNNPLHRGNQPATGPRAAVTTSASSGGSVVNKANVAANRAAMAAYNAEIAKPHGLAQGYSVNPNINFNDKVKVHGGEDYMSEHTRTYDDDLSKLAGVLTLAKQWIAPKRPTLLAESTRIDPGNEHGGGAVHGDRQDSQSDRNSSNYGGPGPANPTNRPSGVGKTGKSGSSSGSGRSTGRSGSSRGSLIGGKSGSSGGYGQSPGGDNRR